MLNNKQNVFDDFIAAAEYLHDQNSQDPGEPQLKEDQMVVPWWEQRCFKDLIYLA